MFSRKKKDKKPDANETTTNDTNKADVTTATYNEEEQKKSSKFGTKARGAALNLKDNIGKLGKKIDDRLTMPGLLKQSRKTLEQWLITQSELEKKQKHLKQETDKLKSKIESKKKKKEKKDSKDSIDSIDSDNNNNTHDNDNDKEKEKEKEKENKKDKIETKTENNEKSDKNDSNINLNVDNSNNNASKSNISNKSLSTDGIGRLSSNYMNSINTNDSNKYLSSMDNMNNSGINDESKDSLNNDNDDNDNNDNNNNNNDLGIDVKKLPFACGIVLLSTVAGGFVHGIEGSTGIVIFRLDHGFETDSFDKPIQRWSQPCAIAGGGVSTGLQLGISKIDQFIVLTHPRQVKTFLGHGQFQLGAKGEATFGDKGASATGGVNISDKAVSEMVCYTLKAKGFLAGIKVSISGMAVNKDVNCKYYANKNVTIKDIVNDAITLPPENEDYNKIINILKTYFPQYPPPNHDYYKEYNDGIATGGSIFDVENILDENENDDNDMADDGGVIMGKSDDNVANKPLASDDDPFSEEQDGHVAI